MTGAESHHLTLSPSVGGHAGMLRDAARGLILKPLPPGDARAARERAFYEAAAPPLAAFLPRFHGVRAVRGLPHLALEDLAGAPFALPCVLDVKMGVRSWGEGASEEKAAREAAKWPPQARLGLRFTGMRVGRLGAGGAPEWRAWRARALPCGGGDEAPVAALTDFLGGGAGDGSARLDVVPPLLEKLRALEAWFCAQREFRFYGSSLLLVYDGVEAGGGRGDGGGAAVAPRAPPAVQLRMIDFAHACRAEEGAPPGCDAGYLVGLRTLARALRSLLHAGGAS